MAVTVRQMKRVLETCDDHETIRFSFMNDPDEVDTVEFHSVRKHDGFPIISGEVLTKEDE